MNDIYIQYWEAVLESIHNLDVRLKLEREIKERVLGLQKDTKCTLIGARCNWPYCERVKRLNIGYCAP